MVAYTGALEEKEVRDFEVRISTLGRRKDTTFEECKRYSCESIANNMTKLNVKKGEIVEIPKGTPFRFFGQVDDGPVGPKNDPKKYFERLRKIPFLAGSIISNKNISHYSGSIFYMYNIEPESIAHVFPMDSNTNNRVKDVRRLTIVPSCWITFSELEEMTSILGGYNQVTCFSKKLKPFAIAAFDRVNADMEDLAEKFGVGIVLLHPDTFARRYVGDMIVDYHRFKEKCIRIMSAEYQISVRGLFWEDK